MWAHWGCTAPGFKLNRKRNREGGGEVDQCRERGGLFLLLVFNQTLNIPHTKIVNIHNKKSRIVERSAVWQSLCRLKRYKGNEFEMHESRMVKAPARRKRASASGLPWGRGEGGKG